MKIAKNLLLLMIFLPLNTHAQEAFKNYTWADKPDVTVPEKYKNEEEVVLDRMVKIEIAVEGSEAAQYYLYSEKTYINSNDAVERNNRVYIPFGENEKVIANKLRVIQKSGKIITLSEGDIKEEIDEEKNMKYHYYAVNGLEKGAVIERYFILQELPELDGKTYRMQDNFPIAKSSFELVYPAHLDFLVKSYNGLPEAQFDGERYPDKKVKTITDADVPGLKDDEKYSNWAVNVKLVRFKLTANAASGARNMYNFNEFAGRVYERYHPELDKKQLKAVADFAKTIAKSNDALEQIWNIENKIKKTIAYNRYFETKGEPDAVIKAKQANQADLLSLYLAVFQHFGIEHNIVFTSSRYRVPFDNDFQSFENLDEIMIYFPATKSFVAPTELEYRTPLFPDDWGNNNGLFIKEKLYAGVKMGIAETAFIPLPDQNVTHDVMDITVDFTKDTENPLITSHMTFGGYSALNFQPIKDFVPEEEYKKILKQVSENYTQQPDYKALTTENDGMDNVGRKPFVMNLTFEGKNLVQKAGDNYLFKIGQIIGSQMELYQENKRTLPVEIDHPHSYLRKIKVLLPAGYKVKNPEKLTMDFKTDVNGKTEAAFVSKYTASATALEVENVEYYNVVHYPLSIFDAYKAVINAAADFNKVVIVLSKS